MDPPFRVPWSYEVNLDNGVACMLRNVLVGSFGLAIGGIAASPRVVAQEPIIGTSIADITYSPDYDVVYVDTTAPENASEWQAWKSAIVAAAASHTGQLIVEDDQELYLKFTSRAGKNAFFAFVESGTTLGSGCSDPANRVVTQAVPVIPGVSGCASYTPLTSTEQSLAKNDVMFDMLNVVQGWASLPSQLTKTQIAILDTGCNRTYPDLDSFAFRYIQSPEGFTVYDPDMFKIIKVASPADTVPWDYDGSSHGTSLASIISARPGGAGALYGCGPDIQGLGSVFELMIVRTYISSSISQIQQASAIDFGKGVQYARTHGADVICLAISLSDFDLWAPKLEKQSEIAIDQGIVIVAAAGNDDGRLSPEGAYNLSASKLKLPAAFNAFLTVGAIRGPDGDGQHSRKKLPAANWGNEVDVSAYGDELQHATKDNGLQTHTGTSLATAQVAALAGLVKAIRPTWSADEVQKVIYENTTSEVPKSGDPNKRPSRNGTIDFRETIEAAIGGSNPIIDCVGVAAAVPDRITVPLLYSEEVYHVQSGVETKLNLHDDDDACVAKTDIGSAADGRFLALKSLAPQSGIQQTEISCREFAGANPSNSLTVSWRAELDSGDGQGREMELRFFNYSKEKWGTAHVVTLANGASSTGSFQITSNLSNYVTGQANAVRCRIRVRPGSSGATASAFTVKLDQLSIVAN